MAECQTKPRQQCTSTPVEILVATKSLAGNRLRLNCRLRMGSTFRLALIQLGVGSNKSENLARAVARVGDAARYIYLPACYVAEAGKVMPP